MQRASLFSILFLIPLFASVAQGVSFLEISNGKGITVLNSAAAQELISSATDKGLEVLTYDQMTGILIAEKTDVKTHPVSVIPLQPMDTVHDESGKKVGTVIGTERKNDNKILPFGYLRIQYYSVPLPSGTFLYNSKKQLCAILYNSDKKHNDQGYATPIKAVLRGAEDFKKNAGKISSGRIGIITSTSGSIPEVLSVRPDQPADIAGIKKGDFLLQIGSQKISTYLEMREAFYYLIIGKPERFTIMRDGQQKVITITPVGG